MEDQVVLPVPLLDSELFLSNSTLYSSYCIASGGFHKYGSGRRIRVVQYIEG